MGLDIVELVYGVEDHFEISIPDDVAPRLESVGLLHEFICAELHRLGRNTRTPQKVMDELVGLVSKHSGINAAKILPESRFVDDLRMD